MVGRQSTEPALPVAVEADTFDGQYPTRMMDIGGRAF